VMNTTQVGLEARDLLMEILEPLLGDGIRYGVFMVGVHNFMHCSEYILGNVGQKENVRRFLDAVIKGRTKGTVLKPRIEQ
jgi:hypothetical protein